MYRIFWLALFVLSATVFAYHPTEDEMARFYGEKNAHDAELPPLSPLLKNLTWRMKAQADTFRGAAGDRLFIGAISNYGEQHSSDTNYSTVLAAQYSLNTAENDCKWASIEPNENQYSWTQCDFGSDFAKNSSAVFRGHNLCWGQYNPSWILNGGYSASQLENYLKDHITQCVTRYSGGTKTRAYCWDVVNEAITDDGSSTVFKPAPPWYPAISNYVDLAFQYARSADGTMKLFYNEYGAEGSGTKSDKVYNMVKSMKDRGIPIDGVGLQMHVSTSYYPSPNDVTTNMKRLTALGLEVQITEMDVQCPDNSQLDKQAQIYGAMLQACLNVAGCTSFQTWGFTDKYSWLGTSQHPLPFDENYGWKPAAYTILSTLQA